MTKRTIELSSSGIEAINAYELLLLDAVILLASGFGFSYLQHSLRLVTLYRSSGDIAIEFK